MATGFAAWTNQFGFGLSLKQEYLKSQILQWQKRLFRQTHNRQWPRSLRERHILIISFAPELQPGEGTAVT
jgi:hypothetical protein